MENINNTQTFELGKNPELFQILQDLLTMLRVKKESLQMASSIKDGKQNVVINAESDEQAVSIRYSEGKSPSFQIRIKGKNRVQDIFFYSNLKFVEYLEAYEKKDGGVYFVATEDGKLCYEFYDNAALKTLDVEFVNSFSRHDFKGAFIKPAKMAIVPMASPGAPKLRSTYEVMLELIKGNRTIDDEFKPLFLSCVDADTIFELKEVKDSNGNSSLVGSAAFIHDVKYSKKHSQDPSMEELGITPDVEVPLQFEMFGCSNSSELKQLIRELDRKKLISSIKIPVMYAFLSANIKNVDNIFELK